MTSFWLLQVFLHFFAFPFYFFLLSGRSAASPPLGSDLPIPYDGPAVLDINFDYAVAGDLAFEDGA